MADCPCMENCPNGCEDCPHELCPCADNGGEDYQTCADFFEAQFWLCAKNCDHDEACFSACNREYDKNLLKCPCQVGCPNGENKFGIALPHNFSDLFSDLKKLYFRLYGFQDKISKQFHK